MKNQKSPSLLLGDLILDGRFGVDFGEKAARLSKRIQHSTGNGLFLPVAVSPRAEFSDENIQVQIEFCSHQKHLVNCGQSK